MLQTELKVIGGKQSGKVIPLTTQKFLIGREQDCHLRPNSELVSRHHCVFTQDDFGLRLRDLGSTNGTFVNGERLRGQVMLKAGDRVNIGKLDFEILLRESAPVGPAPLPVPEATGAPSESQGAAVSAETTELSGADTSFDIPVTPPEGDAGYGSGDTMIIKQLPEGFEQPAGPEASEQPGAPEEFEQPAAPQPPEPPVAGQPPVPQIPQQPAPAYPQQPPMAYPQPPPGQYPPQVPYQPMPGAPYPMAPQYPAQPMYPQQPMAYPQQPVAYPQQPEFAPPQTAPMEEEAAATEDDGGSVPVPPTQLPPPEATGAQPAQPPAGQDGEQGADKPAEPENPSQKAADIIKQYMHRRPEV